MSTPPGRDAGASPLHDVVGEAVLLRFPLRLWRRQQEHTHDLLREFQLLVSTSAPDQHELPRRLLAVAETFVVRYGAYSATIAAEREAALDAGLVTIDSHVPMPAETPELVGSVSELLADVDEYCRTGDLLTLSTPADVVALREWTMREMLRQYAGEPPEPWTGPLD